MPLDATKIEWLNRIAGTSLPPPPTMAQDGGNAEGNGPEDDDEQAIKQFLAAALLAKNEQEEFDAEQMKALAIDDANRAIAPVKEKLRLANGITLKTQEGIFDFLANNTENVGDVRDIKDGSVLAREDLGDSGFDPKKHKKELEKLNKKAAEALSEKEKARRSDLLARQKSLDDITARIAKDAAEADQLIKSVKAAMEGKTRPRSMLNWAKSVETCQKAIGQQKKPDATCVVFIETQQPLFSVNELIDELFTPLVNEKVLGENFVTKEFSKTQRMLDATNALYMEELKDAKDPSTGLAAFTTAMIDVGATLATGVMSAAGVDGTLAKGLLTGCTELAKLAITAADKLPDSLDAATVGDLLQQLPGIIGPMVGSAIGSKDIGALISGGGGVAVGVGKTMVDTIRNGKPSPDMLGNVLSDIVKFGFKAGGVDIGLAETITSSALRIGVQYSTAFYGAIKTGDKRQLRSLSMSISLEIAGVAAGLPGDINSLAGGPDGAGGDAISQVGETAGELLDMGKQAQDERKALKEKIAANNEAAQSRLGAQAKGSASPEQREKFEQLRKMAAESYDMLEAQLAPAAKQRGEESEPDYANVKEIVEAQMKAESEEFERELQGMNDPLIDDKALEKLMKQIQRDAAIMKIAVAVAQAGFSLAANFVAPMAIGTEAVKMAANIKAAVERAQALRKFLDTAVGAKNATSPYLTSIQNFADNQQNQLTHYSIAAALNGAKIIAAAVATGFPLAAPAVTAVGAAQASEEALYAFYTQQQCANAWATTKEALNDPTNRRLGLKARRLNSTLAKYCIAYGATEEKDPVAIQMANACGLDNNALKSKDANVANVVTLMEMKFSDDSKVVGAYTQDTMSWVKNAPPAALDTKTVYRTYQAIREGLKAKIEATAGIAEEDVVPPGTVIGYLKAFAEPDRLPDPASFDPKAVKPGDITPAMLEAAQERVLMVGRMGAALREEGWRLSVLDGTVLDVILEIAELAAAEQERLTTVFMRLKVLEVTAQQNAAKASKATTQAKAAVG
jgi:hypothetical protein